MTPLPQIFERGDRIYITTPVASFAPTPDQMEEFAFKSAVKAMAPNENLAWLKGQYVEADQPNRNGAMWRGQELAIKGLTPMLMPVTVMHDPRTAVGTIADVKLLTPEKDKVALARLDTILAIWAHRFPDVMQEVAVNVERGELMQSMECFSPWYECSTCHAVYQKLPHGAEKASWCDHLRQSDPSGGYVASNSQTQAWRILGDVCFTGTGLIFGSRGVKGALPTANLEEFRDEVAEHFDRVHTDTARTARSTRMGLVQIEESELALLRQERNDAKRVLDDEKAARTDAEKKVEETEAKLKTAEKEKADADKRATDFEEKANQAKLRDDRMSKLGPGFIEKLGDFTKSRLGDQAASYSDDEWDNRLKEVEEIAGVKRDAEKSAASGDAGKSGDPEEGKSGGDKTGQTFGSEEVASFLSRAGSGQGNGDPNNGSGEPRPQERQQIVGSVVSSFRKTKARS